MRISFRTLYWISLILLISFLSACAGTPSAPTPTPIRVATVTPTATLPPSPTATPTDTPVPTPPAPSAKEIFKRISPAVAFIETPTGSGSGFLIQGGYLLTNAHVVWPYENVRVVFPDGTEFKNAHVANWDLIVDVAVIGPLSVDLPPVPLADGENLSIGSDVYLIGYPAEVEEFPQPTFTQGVLSRFREWEQGHITLIESDAPSIGGQSGGVLISESGKVIGMTGYSFYRGFFAIASSISDILPLAQQMIAGKNTDGLNRPPISRPIAGKKKFDISINNFWEQDVFLFWPEPDSVVNIDLDSDWGSTFQVFAATGGCLDREKKWDLPGVYGGQFRIESDEPHFVIVNDTLDNEVAGTLTSSVPLRYFSDPDDHLPPLTIGSTIRGALDFVGDVDVFSVKLQEGQSVYVRIESLTIDPYLSIFLPAQDMYIAADYNSGGGVFGLDAELAFRAPKSGKYLIIVQDESTIYDCSEGDWGGYFLTIEAFEKGDPTPIVLTPTPTPIVTEAGRMSVYTSPFTPRFTIQYPAEWISNPANFLCESNKNDSLYFEIAACLGNDLSGLRLIVYDRKTMAPYLKNARAIAKLFPDFRVLEKKKFTNPNGVDFLTVHLRSKDGAEHDWIAVTNIGQFIISARYALQGTVSDDELRDFEKMVIHSINSFDIRDN